MIKVLVLSADTDGIGFWRNFMPHLTINDPEFEIDVRLLMDNTLNLLDPQFMSQYNMLFYNKAIPFAKAEYFQAFYEMINHFNIKICYDLDDFWILSPTHLNYNDWKRTKSDEVILDSIRKAHHVTTTTPLFANKIREVNTNVTVLENAVNLEEQQWTFNRLPSDKIRFLWGGGISHMTDLRLLKNSFSLFDKDFLSKSQLFMCGYDLRIRTPKGMIMKSDPRSNQWSFFENIFTNNGKYLNNNKYRDFLNSGDSENYGKKEEFDNEFYIRRWTKPILLYGTMYNEADVCLAPLKNNDMFNMYKSNLKIIESGAHHCPIIASNFGPYTIDDVEGKIDGKQKGFLIDENNSRGWYEKMKFYVDNPDVMREHGENLYNYVKDNLSSVVVGEKRKKLYKKLVEG